MAKGFNFLGGDCDLYFIIYVEDFSNYIYFTSVSFYSATVWNLLLEFDSILY